ncbi:MAG: tetratricopeptide repeat protein [Candidatus Aminicenantes bacterium]|nr:tetratricopeptide repeat protein [Candidatus Aminicenantes bacterium]
MVKKLSILGLLAMGLAACATVAPPPPSLYIESPTPAYSAQLSLDDRLTVEQAWDYLRQGRTDKAEKALLRLDPGNPFYYAGFGYTAFLNGNLSIAEQYFLRSAEEYPDMPIPHLGLGQIYQKVGQTDSAYNEYLEVLKRNPENPWAKKEAEAIRLEKTETLMGEARDFASLGNAAKSRESYLKALEYSPKLQEAHLALARIYLKEKSFQSALFHLKTADSNEPKTKAILEDYADALFQAGQLSRSLDTYQRLLDIDPQNKLAQERAETIKNRLGVVDLPSQYHNIPSLEAVTKEDVSALIGVKFKDVLDETPPKLPVIVDITTSWAFQHIVRVASYEIMEVFSNRTFQPRKTVTRAEMADILVRLVALLKKRGYKIIEQVPIERVRIADVPREHFYFQPIAQVIAYQLLDLAPDRTFKPELPMPGREAIKALDLLLGLIK